MARPIRVGVQIPPGGTPSYAAWRGAVLRAEELGADVICGYDHFHKPFVEFVDGEPKPLPDPPEVNNFEGWTALATWGEITSRAQIGLLVTGIGFRNPDLLADMARTVDHISGGRAILGLGVGWYEKDYTAYGYEYGTVASRLDLFDEGLIRIEHRLAELVPPPVRPIPILIGGAGERRTLPAVARHADIWHSFLDIETFRNKSAHLDRLAEQFDRDPSDIERAVAWIAAEEADAYVDAGATLFTTEIHATDAGYDLAVLAEMVAWRDSKAASSPSM